MAKPEDVAVYPEDEENLHDLYSKDCQCHPTVEVIGAVLMYSHNRIRTIIKPIRDIPSQLGLSKEN